MCDKLVEVEMVHWSNLRDLYLHNWPVNFLGYYTLDNFVNWIRLEPSIKDLHIYCLNGEWNDGTFIAIERYQLFLNSLNETNEKLLRLLQLIDWKYGFKVSTYLERHRSTLLEAIKLKMLNIEVDSENLLYFLPREKAAKLDVVIPEGFTIGNLTEDDAAVADAVWPYKHVGSLFLLKRLAKLNANAGIFNHDGQLVAWCFRLQAGPVGALQVDNNYHGKGFGTLVCKAVTKKIGELDQDVCACLVSSNKTSRRIFEKIGFNIVDKVYWLRTTPLIPNEWYDK